MERLRRAGLSAAAAFFAATIAVYPRLLGSGSASSWGSALMAAGLASWALSFAGSGGFWDPLRCRLVGLGAGLWGAYLVLFSRQLTLWVLDLPLFAVALGLWLGRTRADCLLGSLGILAVVGFRHAGSERVVRFLDLALFGALLFGGARWVEARLASAGARADPAGPRRSAARLAGAVAVFAILAVYAARPAWLMVDPERRRRALEALSPSFPVQDPASLSPLAARLHGHVVALARDIGERSAYQPDAQEKAKDYVLGAFRDAGFAAAVFDYRAERPSDFARSAPFRNLEATLPGTGRALPEWIVGAHYDTAPGTPGADDNASGVAALLEAARLLRARRPARGIRFVAFGTEEPPAFGSRDMGSYRYARDLKGRGVAVHGMVNLEMLGYFNPRPSSQLFPPFLSLFYPDRADFIGLVSNVSSAPFMGRIGASWRRASKTRVEMTILPSAFSALALSDQLNFWHAGYRAVVVSDTSFFRYPHYHQAEDTPEKLDYERLAQTVEALVEVLSASDLAAGLSR
ncbi:MAG: M20/M25/M40 family metallo-hydrolase [Elusimicrobia bacterium]|nr:M20/M25/M40 family metallo-hydrolase [Elusimicrobiota bacterium]